MVGITSWVVRIFAFISVVTFFIGAYIFQSGSSAEYGSDEDRYFFGAVIMGLSFLFMIMVGAVAVIFRISEQTGEINRHLAFMLAPALDRISAQLDFSNGHLASLRLLTSQGMGIEDQVPSEKIIAESDDESSQHEGDAGIPIR